MHCLPSPPPMYCTHVMFGNFHSFVRNYHINKKSAATFLYQSKTVLIGLVRQFFFNNEFVDIFQNKIEIECYL